MRKVLYFCYIYIFTNQIPQKKSLREIDIELMRRLSPRVNVIPVVGRADSLTPQELKDFKRRVSFLSFYWDYVSIKCIQMLDHGRYWTL